jgi:hypothetical protein
MKLDNEELSNVYISYDVIVISARKLRWAEKVARRPTGKQICTDICFESLI